MQKTPPPTAAQVIEEVRPGQSIELLKELHILTRDGRLNQDSRRKLKQVYHLYQFIAPFIAAASPTGAPFTLADHGAGKSYLGFIIYDLFFNVAVNTAVNTAANAVANPATNAQPKQAPLGHIYGIETRTELVEKSRALATRLGFEHMSFLNLSVQQASTSVHLPPTINIVTALHACDTATDDAIAFGLAKRAQHMALVPCCQAEVAGALKKNRALALAKTPLAELWQHPLHAREFGSQITNVLRCLQLQASGYSVTVTELVGWEHSMKNELILASLPAQPNAGKTHQAQARLQRLLAELGLGELAQRFTVRASAP